MRPRAAPGRAPAGAVPVGEDPGRLDPGIALEGRGEEAPGALPESETAAEAAVLLGTQGIAKGLIVSRLPEDVLDVLFLVAHLFQHLAVQILCSKQ